MSESKFKKDKKFFETPSSWQQKMGMKMAMLGVIPIPFVIFKYQKRLKLLSSDLLLIGLIYKYKQGFDWSFFSLAKITRNGGLCQDTLHNSKNRLIKLGYLAITSRKGENRFGKGRNTYDLSGLKIAVEKIIDENRAELIQMKMDADDILEFAVLKHVEKEIISEIQRSKHSEIGEG